ncbi:MAG: hypothetical protein Q8R13_06255 [bacterium]|nr:hypothetical protein [bacterium]MDZ4296532.1 hypothetical protein [Patescibacteria group bacterium]
MKLYQISSPDSRPTLVQLDTPGELVGDFSKPLKQITIGESGRGRSEGIIPIIGEGPEVRARKTDDGVVLVRGSWDDAGRCLAIINAVGAYDRHRTYGVLDSQGVQTIASGTFAFGQAGRTNSGEEVLAILTPGATFRLNSKYASTWYMWTGTEWIMESPEARKARLALQKVEQGEGEWL